MAKIVYFVKVLLVLFIWKSGYNSTNTLYKEAEAFQIFLRDAHILPKLLSYEEYTADVTCGKVIACLYVAYL
jgi:hypothetical protein